MQEQSSTTNQNHLASQFRVSRCPQPGSIARAICKQIHFWQPRKNQKFIKKSSKVHQKFIKISQITISGSKISKVHQKCNAARVKLHLLETVFQLRTPLLLHYQSQHARICRVRAHTRARIRKRTCINVCIWTEKVCNSSTLLKGKFLLRSLTNAFVFKL